MTQQFFTTPLSTGIAPDRAQIVDLLRTFCREAEFATQGTLRCVLTPGFLTTMGQEYRATLNVANKGLEHVLFRVYLPTSGLPASFDFYDQDLKVCASVDEVRAALSGFAQEPSTRETLLLLSQQAP